MDLLRVRLGDQVQPQAQALGDVSLNKCFLGPVSFVTNWDGGVTPVGGLNAAPNLSNIF